MTYADMHRQYVSLREQLEAAYAAPRWDDQGIDLIADQMLLLERGLSATGGTWSGSSSTCDTLGGTALTMEQS